MVAKDRDWIPVKDFMAQHGLSKNLVYDKLTDGTLAHVRVGRRILIKSDALDQLREAQAESGGG